MPTPTKPKESPFSQGNGTFAQPLPSGPVTPPYTPAATPPGGTNGQVQYNNAGAFGGITGVTNAAAGIPTALTVGAGVITAITKTTPVADGTYTVGLGGSQDGTITITNGVITAVQEAMP